MAFKQHCSKQLAQETVRLTFVKDSARTKRMLYMATILLLSSILFYFTHSDLPVLLYQEYSAKRSQDEKKLRLELERLRIDNQIGMSSRQALEQTIAKLDEKLKQVELELTFIRSNSTASRTH